METSDSVDVASATATPTGVARSDMQRYMNPNTAVLQLAVLIFERTSRDNINLTTVIESF